MFIDNINTLYVYIALHLSVNWDEWLVTKMSDS